MNDISVLFVVWVATVIGAACFAPALARRREIDPVGAVICVLLLGLIGIAILCVIPGQSPAGNLPDRPRRKCPRCAELIFAEARVCRFCGHEFATPVNRITVADPWATPTN
jgi:hypothetical protein